jgi:hypothetical protein
MSELTRATLIELNQAFTSKKDGGREVEVQFNPETLKVTYANQIVQPQGGDQSAGNAGRQFIGAGTTKLALQLWFDVNAMEKDPVDDVRRLTQKVTYFMTPQKSDQDPTKLAPPGLRFQWGSFIFDGMVDGIEESLEFFSPDGKPLRASISLAMSQQKILASKFEGEGNVPARPGEVPLRAAKQGASLQTMAGKYGKGDWQSIAEGNGIEDPLRMATGTLVDLNARASSASGKLFGASLGVTAGVSASASLGATVRANASTGATALNASLGGAPSGSLSVG